MKSKSKKLMIVLLCIALAMTFSFTGSVFAEEGQPATTESSTAVENSAQTENASAAESSAQEGKTSVANKEASADTEKTATVEEKAASEGKNGETPKSDESASETKDNGSASKGEESSDVKTPDVSKLTELLRLVSSKIGPLKAAYYYGRNVERVPASQEEVDEAIAIVSKTITEYNELNRLKSRATALQIDVNNVDAFLKENSVRINGVFIREKEKQKEEALKNTATQYFFNVGERVFHEKLGVGEIADVIQIGESTMYTIDFGKMGKKAMDATYARLKKL